MASMEDLIATISGGMHVGQQANDLKDLQAKLSQTLNPTIPTYRPVPPSSNALNNAAVPPAPASSWNSPPPANSFLASSPYTARQMGYPGVVKSTGGKRDVGFAPAPAPSDQSKQEKENGVSIQNARPYHAEVLPERASPAKTDGFAEDAFKPIWSKEDGKQNGAFTKSR